MPTVTCPRCAQPTALPDPWPNPGYTCPYCHTAVSFAPAAPVAPADPFGDLARESPSQPVYVRHRNQTRAREAARTAFGEGFGRVFGEFAANTVIAVAVLGMLAIALFVYLQMRK